MSLGTEFPLSYPIIFVAKNKLFIGFAYFFVGLLVRSRQFLFSTGREVI